MLDVEPLRSGTRDAVTALVLLIHLSREFLGCLRQFPTMGRCGNNVDFPLLFCSHL
jgi:hypothetical protein